MKVCCKVLLKTCKRTCSLLSRLTATATANFNTATSTANFNIQFDRRWFAAIGFSSSSSSSCSWKIWIENWCWKWNEIGIADRTIRVYWWIGNAVLLVMTVSHTIFALKNKKNNNKETTSTKELYKHSQQNTYNFPLHW